VFQKPLGIMHGTRRNPLLQRVLWFNCGLYRSQNGLILVCKANIPGLFLHQKQRNTLRQTS